MKKKNETLESLCPYTFLGCGLVANSLLSKLREEEGQPRPLSGLEELILLSYEDDHPIQTCEGGLLADTLAGAAGLRVLSLEGNFASFLDDDFFLRCWAHGAMRRLEVLDTQVQGEGGKPALDFFLVGGGHCKWTTMVKEGRLNRHCCH